MPAIKKVQESLANRPSMPGKEAEVVRGRMPESVKGRLVGGDQFLYDLVNLQFADTAFAIKVMDCSRSGSEERPDPLRYGLKECRVLAVPLEVSYFGPDACLLVGDFFLQSG